MVKTTSIAEAALSRTVRNVRTEGSIKEHGGAITIDGPGIDLLRFLSLLSGLRLEVATKGKMRLSRGVNCWTIAKREFQLKGNRESVLAQLEAIYERATKKEGV